MFHLSLYSVTPGGASSALDMPAVTDPSITITNGHPLFQIPVSIVLAYLLGNAQTRYAAILTPKLQATVLPVIRPIDSNTSPQTRPPVDDYAYAPLPLDAVEENAVQLYTAAGAQVLNVAALWFSDRNMNTPSGTVYTAHASAVINPTAYTWSPSVFTLDRPLPAGTYAVVGLDVVHANAWFARLIFPSQPWRPGIIVGTTFGFINCPRFRFGRLPTFGTFTSYAQPQIELFGPGGSATADIFLDLVKIT